MLSLSQFNFNGFTFHGTSVLNLPSSESEESFCTCVTFSWWESEEQQCIFSTSLNNPVPLVFNSKILQLYLFSVYYFFFFPIYIFSQPVLIQINLGNFMDFHEILKIMESLGQYHLVPHTRRKDVCVFCFAFSISILQTLCLYRKFSSFPIEWALK